MKKFLSVFLPCLLIGLLVWVAGNWFNRKPDLITGYNVVFSLVMSVLITIMAIRAADTEQE